MLKVCLPSEAHSSAFYTIPTDERTMSAWLIRLAAFALAFSVVSAAPASPHAHRYRQPDNAMTPELLLNGDEFYSWKTDKNGYTVIQDDKDWYVYARKVDGELVSSNVRVGYSNPKKLGLTPHLKTDPDKRPSNGLVQMHQVERDHRELIKIPSTAMCSFQGTKENPCRLRGLVVLIRFSDHKTKKLPDPEEYDILFNHNGPTPNSTAPTGSVANVFMENSYDSFVLETKVVPYWVDVPRTEQTTVAGNYGLNLGETRKTWKMSLDIVERKGFNFRDVDQDNDGVMDCLVLMHSGPAAETGGTDCETGKNDRGRIWSHATEQTWFTSKSGVKNKRFYVASAVWDACPPGRQANTKWAIARIAVIAHECAHFLGLPDTYDTQGGAGLGSFDLLANMWGWMGTQYYPPLMNAWCKMKLQWVNVIHVTHSDEFVLHPACTDNRVYKISHNMPRGEYLLIEYRGDCGFDSELRHSSDERGRDRDGAALWHVDESGLTSGITYTTEGYPGDGQYPRKHYKVALKQADGDWDLEKGRNRGDGTDLFRRSDSPWSARVAYKIDNQGLTFNNGDLLPGVNTKSYARNGKEEYTGIAIEFGQAGATMTMKVTLDGAPKPPPTLPPTPRPTPMPTPPTPNNNVGRNNPIPPACNKGKSKKNKICFSGVGKKPTKIYYKSCYWIVKKKLQATVCSARDIVQGKSVSQICQKACGMS